MTRPAKTALALGKIDLEEKTTDLRLKLKGKLAVDLADYQRAFAQANDQSLELDQLVPHILAAFIDAGQRLPGLAQGAARLIIVVLPPYLSTGGVGACGRHKP